MIVVYKKTTHFNRSCDFTQEFCICDEKKKKNKKELKRPNSKSHLKLKINKIHFSFVVKEDSTVTKFTSSWHTKAIASNTVCLTVVLGFGFDINYYYYCYAIFIGIAGIYWAFTHFTYFTSSKCIPKKKWHSKEHTKSMAHKKVGSIGDHRSMCGKKFELCTSSYFICFFIFWLAGWLFNTMRYIDCFFFFVFG